MPVFNAKNQQQFKKFNRQRRVEYSEETFASGMKYATSPLDTGFARSLVNYDLHNEGLTLVPRQGLRTYEMFLGTSWNKDYYKGEQYIYHAAENIEEDKVSHTKVLMGRVDATDANKNDIVKPGYLNVLTLNRTGTPYHWYNNTEANIDCYNMLFDRYDDRQVPDQRPRYKFFFNSPAKANIHGMDLPKPELIATHIGTELAAEGTTHYYCFAEDIDTKERSLLYTPYGDHVVALTSHHTSYYFDKIIPQETTAYDASRNMYNMLQDDPYVFNDRDGSDSLHFMGMYTVDENGRAVQSTYINTPYTYRINYAVNRGGTYKLLWEWKEPAASVWTPVEEARIITFPETGELPKLEITWTAPSTSVIIRVQCFPLDDQREVVNLKTFSTTAPKTASEGDKYYNPDVKKIYTYKGNAWTDEVYPRVSVLYARDDEEITSEDSEKQLYRWAGNIMEATDKFDYVSSDIMLQTIVYAEAQRDATQQIDYLNYDLSTCRGMCTWQHRLCVYGPEKGQNMLFLSEPNNPAWFPFPRNVDLFNEPIVHCTPYLDYLLVFTTSALYQITLSSDGDSWKETCLQRNLNINAWDIPLIKIIKNMVFFKSSNYFYMVVPSASSASGLTIAPISTNIEQFLDNFEESVEELLIEVYDIKKSYELVRYKNFVNYKNIYNVYTFKVKKGPYINMFLIYNIETRYWSTYFIQSDTMLESYIIDIADVNLFMSYVAVKDNSNNSIAESVQFLKFDDLRKDFYIPTELTIYDDVENICYDKQIVKNYQFIDTGYREHESDFKKRYRELQFKLNNYAQLDLTFYTQFWLDGYLRQDESSYKINQVVDRRDPRFGVITYDRSFEYRLKTPYEYIYDDDYIEDEKRLDRTAGHKIPGSTILGTSPLLPDEHGHLYRHNPDEKTIDKLMWKLDLSELPETLFWKVRFPVSGKGYVPRLKMLNMDQEKFELLNISWVYRNLYSR